MDTAETTFQAPRISTLESSTSCSNTTSERRGHTLLKAQFEYFWGYQAVWAARRYLKRSTTQAMRSRFHARIKLALGATEGSNYKARITTRKAYGFRTYRHAELAIS